MTRIFTLIFFLSIAAGATWAYTNDLTAAGYVMSLAVAGFAGSSIIAVAFSYLYFCQQETDQEKIHQLQHKINDLKEIKRIKQ